MKLTKSIFSQNKAVIAIFLLLIVAASGFAQVDEEEIKNLPPVVFINYEGPHARLDTREEIRQIGVGLGRQIANSERAGANNRYFVIHSVTDQENNKLNADILGLGVDTGVDHVRNLRVIIQGYLQTAYNYSASDALLLAEYITIYNAVYRGNWDFFTSRYKTPVINNLTSDRAGLSIRYDEWPGRTLLLIPLGHGGLSSIDTSAISDSRVIEEMRREDDQGVPQRQQMVDLMEREAAQAEQQARTDRQQVREEQRQVAQERTQTEADRQQVQADYQAGRITAEQARAAQEDLARRENELTKREEILQAKSEEVERKSEALEEFAEQKTEDAQAKREEIAADQQSTIAQQGTVTGILGIIIENTDPVALGRIVMLNQTSGEVIRRSPLNLVHIRTVTFIGGRLISIAGENRGNGAVRLVEINQTDLTIAKQGDDDILTGSLLWVNGSDLYAIITDLNAKICLLGRFNTNLILQAKSAVKVHPEASVTILQGNLLTQREDGSALILNPTDLTEIIKK